MTSSTTPDSSLSISGVKKTVVAFFVRPYAQNIAIAYLQCKRGDPENRRIVCQVTFPQIIIKSQLVGLILYIVLVYFIACHMQLLHLFAFRVKACDFIVPISISHYN